MIDRLRRTWVLILLLGFWIGTAKSEPKIVNVDRLPLFVEPNPKSEMLARLPKNQNVEELETQGPWSKIKVNVGGMSVQAWVPAKGLVRSTPSSLTVQSAVIQTPNEIHAYRIVRITDNELRRRYLAVMAAEFKRVPYTGPRDATGRLTTIPVDFSAGHTSWIASGYSSFNREELSLSAENVPVSNNWDASIDMTTWAYASRPDPSRFRDDQAVQYYLWEASITNRNSRSPFSFTAGRVRPWDLPGLTTFDGAQASYRFGSGGPEIGMYGGILPDMISLRPDSQSWAGGLYYEQAYVQTRDYLVRQEIRAGVLRTTDFGSRIEAEARTSASILKWLDFAVDLKAGLGGGNVSADPALDALRFDLGLRPTDKLYIYSNLRFLERQPNEVDVTIYDGARHEELGMMYNIVPMLGVGFNGGASQEVGGSELDRKYVGPEVRLSKWLTKQSDLLLGYQYESGWVDGHFFFIQPSATFLNRYKGTLRASYSKDNAADQIADQWGMFGGFQTPLFSWLVLVCSFPTIVWTDTTGFFGGLDVTGQL